MILFTQTSSTLKNPHLTVGKVYSGSQLHAYISLSSSQALKGGWSIYECVYRQGSDVVKIRT